METKDRKFRITLNYRQMRLVMAACEEYFRLRFGQDADFADDLAEMNHNWTEADDVTRDKVFDKFITTRDHIRALMKAVFVIAFGDFGIPKEKTREMRVLMDVWEAIRFKLGLSRWDKPLIESEEPFPIVEEITDSE